MNEKYSGEYLKELMKSGRYITVDDIMESGLWKKGKKTLQNIIRQMFGDISDYISETGKDRIDFSEYFKVENTYLFNAFGDVDIVEVPSALESMALKCVTIEDILIVLDIWKRKCFSIENSEFFVNTLVKCSFIPTRVAEQYEEDMNEYEGMMDRIEDFLQPYTFGSDDQKKKIALIISYLLLHNDVGQWGRKVLDIEKKQKQWMRRVLSEKYIQKYYEYKKPEDNYGHVDASIANLTSVFNQIKAHKVYKKNLTQSFSSDIQMVIAAYEKILPVVKIQRIFDKLKIISKNPKMKAVFEKNSSKLKTLDTSSDGRGQADSEKDSNKLKTSKDKAVVVSDENYWKDPDIENIEYKRLFQSAYADLVEDARNTNRRKEEQDICSEGLENYLVKKFDELDKVWEELDPEDKVGTQSLLKDELMWVADTWESVLMDLDEYIVMRHIETVFEMKNEHALWEEGENFDTIAQTEDVGWSNAKEKLDDLLNKCRQAHVEEESLDLNYYNIRNLTMPCFRK